MKLYTTMGPNPAVVHMFLAEKAVDVERVQMDLMAGENRKEAHLARNPAGQSPSLELDNGDHVSEITAICEYLDEKFPQPPLMGGTPEERAETRMWVRRIDLNIIEPMTTGFRGAEGRRLFESRMRLLSEAASGDLKTMAKEKLAWLDGLVAGRTWICGERFTLADILLFCFLQFGGSVGQPLAAENKNLTALMDRIKARPSAKAAS